MTSPAVAGNGPKVATQAAEKPRACSAQYGCTSMLVRALNLTGGGRGCRAWDVILLEPAGLIRVTLALIEALAHKFLR